MVTATLMKNLGPAMPKPGISPMPKQSDDACLHKDEEP